MKHIFDSSAIFKAIKENKIEVLTGNYTIELARYEIGNILWKKYALQRKATSQELKNLTKLTKDTLNIMEILQISCHEEEILNTATKLKLTFYDASYTFYAKAEELMLITEDTELLKKATSYTKASKLDDILQK